MTKDYMFDVLSIGLAHDLAQDASDAHDYQKVRAIWDAVSADPDIVGDANDYHNYAVVVSRLDDYRTAFKIAERGLKQFPFNTDLLADAIYYGSNCAEFDSCEKHKLTLLKRPKATWTWRAFTFLIDYLKNSVDWTEDTASIAANLELADKLATAYCAMLSTDGRSYMASYEVKELLSKLKYDEGNLDEVKALKDEAEQVLRDAVFSGKCPATQCALKYAELMFREQNFPEVIKTCEVAMQYGEASPSANLGYIMYLSAMSREILFRKSGREDEKEIRRIYAEYQASLVDGGIGRRKETERRIKMFAAFTQTEIPDGILKDNSLDEALVEAVLRRMKDDKMP